MRNAVLYGLLALVLLWGVVRAFTEYDLWETPAWLAIVVWTGAFLLCLFDGVLSGGKRFLGKIGSVYAWALTVTVAFILVVTAVVALGQPHGGVLSFGFYGGLALWTVFMQARFARLAKKQVASA